MGDMKSALAAYFELAKPRVVALMLLTAVVGMLLATPNAVSIKILILAVIGIGLAAGSGAVMNHLIDRKIDAMMKRTQNRPLPSGKVTAWHAIWFAIILAVVAMLILVIFVNPLTAILTFFTLIGYGVIYTVFLKRATPQNIVIGGIAGAMPPLLGWTAVTNHIDYGGLLLVLIIFMWTPPHFWALSIARHEEYAKADIPMLPVTHGIKFTKLSILFYSLALFACSLLPFVVDMSGLIYFVGAVIFGLIFVYYALRLFFDKTNQFAMPTFHYSIIYLMCMFLLLLVDHYIPLLT